MFKKSIASIFFLLIFANVFAQKECIIKGYVTDNEGALPGATIWLKESQIGTTSNANGYYELRTKAEKNTVVVSFIGKKTQKRIYKGEKKFDFYLEDDLLTLGEVQVTAKPNINELDVRAKTGNVSVVPIMKLKNTPISSLTMALQGKTPGLQIQNRGELGVLPKIRIRGTSSLRKGDAANQPLYILDGKMISAETFFNLNTEDIEELKVLKDAVATALYGIKAANGVIEITSKRGGEKSLAFHIQTGITLKTPLRVELMNSAEKLELERRLQNIATPGYLYSEDYIMKKYKGTALEQEKLKEGARILDSLKQINTDWYDEFARVQSFQKYDLSFRNGNEKMSYLFSLGYLKQGGQMASNDFSRISSRFVLDQALSDNAIASLSFNASYAKSTTPQGATFSPAQLIYDLNPYETMDSKDLYSYPKRSFNDLFNQYSKENQSKNVGASANINWKVNPNLDISAVAGVDFSLSEFLEIIPETAYSEKGKRAKNARGTLTQAKNTLTNISANIRVNYSKTFGKHDLTLGGNADNYTTLVDNLNGEGHGLYGRLHSASAIDNSLTGAGRSIVGGRKQTNRNLGFGSLIAYTYNKRYNLFATYKLDAASVLPKSKRWNAAWAVGASIDMKSYKFLKEIEWLSALSIRGSYGHTANAQGISPAFTNATFQYLSKNYDGIRLMKIMELPNEKLRAEQNRMFDVGLSATLKKTSFHVSLYRRKTIDALLSIPIPSSSGFQNQLQNIGILENKGVEVGINQQVFSSQNWNIRMSGNISYNENKVLDLYGRERIYTGESLEPDYEVGKSIDNLYGLKSTGINAVTGLPEFINHKGEQVDAFTMMKREDFIDLGKTTPPVTGSLFFNIGYKNIQVGMDFYYSLGAIQKYSNTYIRTVDNCNLNAAKAQLTDTWWKEGDFGKKYPNPFYSSGAKNNIAVLPSNKTVVKTDFLRFSNLSIRYQLNSKHFTRIMKQLRYVTLGINAANLFTYSQFKESDPETSNIISPLPPTITFNLNVTF